MRRPAMLRLVLDTNIVLDLLHFEDPSTTALRQALQEKRVECFGNAACRDEFRRVLRYPHFGIDEVEAQRLLDAYDGWTQSCTVEAVAGRLPLCRDADDQKFLELALAARADLLLSKDKALLALNRKSTVLGFRIVTAVAATALLSDGEAGQRL